jgi:hypothetical protein
MVDIYEGGPSVHTTRLAPGSDRQQQQAAMRERIMQVL